MTIKKVGLHLFEHFEEYLCGLLLSAFVLLLFAQIIVRQFFAYSIPWGRGRNLYVCVVCL